MANASGGLPHRLVQVCVLGAGPAGSTAACYLARAGLAVTLVEARAFPRVKVCGEYISPAASAILETIVPSSELVAAGARRVERMALEADGRRTMWQSPAAAWSISRATLDGLLLKKAAAAGVRVLQPTTVRTVQYQTDSVAVLLTDGHTLQADVVVHADGSGRHDPVGAVPLAPGLLAHKCHLELRSADPSTIVMRSDPGAYIGTVAVERGVSTCALVTRRGLLAEFKDVDAMVSHLWPGFRAAWRRSGWKSCGVPRSRYILPGHPRSFRIGNAAAAVDPVGGEGIGLALWAGSALGSYAEAFASLTRGSLDSQSATLYRIHGDMATAYNHRLRTRLPVCQLTAWALMRPRLIQALWPALRVPELSFRPFYRLTGKTDSSPSHHMPGAA